MFKKTVFMRRVVCVIEKLEERKRVASDLVSLDSEKYVETLDKWRSECMAEIEEIYKDSTIC